MPVSRLIESRTIKGGESRHAPAKAGGQAWATQLLRSGRFAAGVYTLRRAA